MDREKRVKGNTMLYKMNNPQLLLTIHADSQKGIEMMFLRHHAYVCHLNNNKRLFNELIVY